MIKFLLSSLTLMAFVGCTPKGGGSTSNVDMNAQTNDVRASLEAVKVGYYGSGDRAFRTDGKVVAPCDKDLLNAIDNAVDRLTSLKIQLNSEGRTSDAQALESDYLKSLNPLRSELDQYCKADAKIIDTCLSSSGGKILTYLNNNTVDYGAVSAVVIPLNAKVLINSLNKTNKEYDYGIYRLNSYQDGTHTVSFVEVLSDGSAYGERPEREVTEFYSNNQSKIMSVSECISSQTLQSATAQQIKSFLDTASVQQF